MSNHWQHSFIPCIILSRRLIKNRDLILPVIDQSLFLHPRHLPRQCAPFDSQIVCKFLAVHGEEGAFSVCGELGQHEFQFVTDGPLAHDVDPEALGQVLRRGLL